MTEEIRRFRGRLKEVPIEIEDKDGQVRNYKIVELSGRLRTQFLAGAVARKASTDPGAQSALMAELLAMSLHGPDGKPVTKAQADELPSDTQIDLFNLSAEISGLNKKGEENAKNP